MTKTEIKSAPQERRSNKKSFLTALVSRRELTGRIMQREAANLDPEYREVLDAIHRPSK